MRVNPKAKEIPVMYGHFREQGFKSDDIVRRINSILKTMTNEDAQKLGWSDKMTLIESVKAKKAAFVEHNKSLA